MDEFLSGSDLSRTIKRIVSGSQVRCAVAFWGAGAVMALFPNVRRTTTGPEIICDLSMGATCPDEIELFRAPKNDKIRQFRKLHAKVYLSDLGVVIGSANASSNEIGLTTGDSGALLEAGTFHEPNSPIWTAASQWFEKTYRESKMIKEADLALARQIWDIPAPEGNSDPVRQGSLLDMIREAPERYPNVGFVFSQKTTRPADAAQAKKAAASNADEDSVNEIMNWPITGIFTNWPQGDVDVWPRIFVNFHKSPRSGLSVSAQRRHHYSEEYPGFVFCRGAWAHFKSTVGRDLPFQADICSKDADIAKYILDGTETYRGKLFSTALEMSKALKAIPPEPLSDW